ncbi:MAG: hypothetical protein AAFS11_06635 [Planctomycetota bacterium]
MPRLSAIAASAVGFALAAATHAQLVDESFTYQGELLSFGDPANGQYDFLFGLYDDETGNRQVGSDLLIRGVQAVDGYVEIPIDFGAGINLFTGGERWLQIEVQVANGFGFTNLGRQKLTATPHASFALASGFAAESGTTLQEAFDNESAIVADDVPISVRATSRNDELLAGENPTGERRVTVSSGGSAGGLLQLHRGTGGVGVRIEGGDSRDSQPSLELLNANPGSPAIRLDLDRAETDDQVQLPFGAINRSEIADEPGISNTNSDTLISLRRSTGLIDTIEAVTIDCPRDGYVVALATAEVELTQILGSRTRAIFGLSDTPTTRGAAQDIELATATALPIGDYAYPVTVHGLFPVAAGSQTIYFQGDWQAGGPVEIRDITLTLIYVPSLYGTASPSRGGFAGLMPSAASPTQINAMATQPTTNDRVRELENELSDMRARLEALEARTNARTASEGNRP